MADLNNSQGHRNTLACRDGSTIHDIFQPESSSHPTTRGLAPKVGCSTFRGGVRQTNKLLEKKH